MVLADGSAIVRAGIKRLLSGVSEIRIVEECADAESAVAAIAQMRPDVVMVDFHLGRRTAVDVLQCCRSINPRPICIVHALDADASTRAISYAAGADVFYDESWDMAPLISMLRKLSAMIAESQEPARG